jgi:hypothetical protein
VKFEFEVEEARELLTAVVDRVLAAVKLDAKDRAALRRWHTETMRPGSVGMRDLAAKVNDDIGRALESRTRSALMKHDWK